MKVCNKMRFINLYTHICILVVWANAKLTYIFYENHLLFYKIGLINSFQNE